MPRGRCPSPSPGLDHLACCGLKDDCAEGGRCPSPSPEPTALRGTGYDLPPVQVAFDEYVASAGLSDRLTFHPGDFFDDPALPRGDVLIMGHILHNWGLDDKRALLRKAHAALPEGGVLLVCDAIIDDDRRHNVFGLMLSLHMVLETAEGFDYTVADIRQWLGETGFRQVRVEPLAGPTSVAIGIK